MIETLEAVQFFRSQGGFFGVEVREADIAIWCDEFMSIHARRPLADNIQGIDPRSSAWLFLAARILDPLLVVESGVWRGHSSWLLRQACPKAEMHSFDLNLGGLRHRERDIAYHENDWSLHRFGKVVAQRSLVFFDDHVSQARRVSESFARGFRFLVFDDNVPAGKAARAGWPPFPTIHMMFDAGLAPGQRISWETKGRKRSYTFRQEDVGGARALIEDHFVFPRTPCYLSMVRLSQGTKGD